MTRVLAQTMLIDGASAGTVLFGPAPASFGGPASPGASASFGGVAAPGGVAPGGGVATVLVPAQEPAPPPGKGPEFGNASPVGLVVVLVLLLATILLIRSMSKRIRRLPESFDNPDEAATTSDDAPATTATPVSTAPENADAADPAHPTDPAQGSDRRGPGRHGPGGPTRG